MTVSRPTENIAIGRIDRECKRKGKTLQELIIANQLRLTRTGDCYCRVHITRRSRDNGKD